MPPYVVRKGSWPGPWPGGCHGCSLQGRGLGWWVERRCSRMDRDARTLHGFYWNPGGIRMDRTARHARPRPIGRIFALAVIAIVFCSVGLSPVGSGRAAAATPDPIVGDWNVTYGAPAVVTVTLSGGLYTVTAKTPVEVTGATCYLPVGTTIATFSSTGPNTYSGQHGLWYTSDCSFGQWDPMTLTLSSDGGTLTAVLAGGYGTVVFTKVSQTCGSASSEGYSGRRDVT